MSNCKSWADAFAPIDAHNRNAINGQTWGHLAPQKNTSYKGKILFSISGYNTGSVLIDSNFTNLEDSPWLYDTMNELISNFADKTKEYGVYLLETTFRNYRFYGTPKKVYSIS